MFKRWFALTPVGRAFLVIDRADRRKLVLATMIQISMGILDLLGVLAFGLMGALSVSGIQGQSSSGRVNEALALLQLTDKSFQFQVSCISVFAITALTGRTVISIIFTRKILIFLSRRGAQITSNLFAKLLSETLITIQRSSSQETLYIVANGVNIITLQIIATSIVLASDFSLLIIMFIGLTIMDPGTSFVSMLMILIIGLVLYRLTHSRAMELGYENRSLNVKSNEQILEVLGSYRELFVRDRRDYYVREIEKVRINLASNVAEISFMPYISKYVVEMSLILGSVIIGGVQFLLSDSAHAVSVIAVFMAAGSRIAPALLRIQQGLITIRGGVGQSAPTFELIEQLHGSELQENTNDRLITNHTGFDSNVTIKDVTFCYPGSLKPAITECSLEFSAGESIAVVGPSGAGKSTLIDVLLGILNVDKGIVLISGCTPKVAISKWQGAIAYVPQDALIVSGTVRENVVLGFPAKEISDDLVFDALRLANLFDFVSEQPLGLDTQVGERGSMISGGQRQRLGIARALLTKPLLLVLDEATSALDPESERLITEALQKLHGLTTVVMIAHRLSSIQNADKIIYLDDGNIVSSGTINEVRSSVPKFDLHCAKLGIK
jgi:ABC-type multidrug transport system fused ATPase/permease subunit